MQKFRNNVIWTTVLTALAGVCLGLLSLYFAAAGSGAMCRFYLKDPLLAALNVLPFVLFALLLFGLTGRAWLAFLLDGVVCLVYSWAAYWKWLGRSEPLYADAEDVHLFFQARHRTGQREGDRADDLKNQNQSFHRCHRFLCISCGSAESGR